MYTFYFRGANRSDPKSPSAVAGIVRVALQTLPGAISEEQLEKVTRPLKADLASALLPVVNILKNSAPPNPQVTPSFRKIVKAINSNITKLAALPSQEWNALVPQQKYSAQQLSQLTGVIVPDKPSAMRLLEMFRANLSRKTFVDRVLKSNNITAETDATRQATT